MSKMIATLSVIAAAIVASPVAHAADKAKSQPAKAEQRTQIPKKAVRSASNSDCRNGRDRCVKNLFGLSGVNLAEAPGKQAAFGNAKGSNNVNQFGPSKGSNAPQSQFGPGKGSDAPQTQFGSGKGSNAPQTQFGPATGSNAEPKGYAVGNAPPPAPPKGYQTGAPKGYPTGHAPAPSKDEKPQGYGTHQGTGYGQKEPAPAQNGGYGGNGGGAADAAAVKEKIAQEDIKG